MCIMEHVEITEEQHMYNKKPWTLNVEKRETNTRSRKQRSNTIYSLILKDVKDNPETIISTNSVVSTYKCSRGVASKCIHSLKKDKKIKLVNLVGEGTSLRAEYQSVKSKKEPLKLAPQKGYMSVSSFLKKKKAPDYTHTTKLFRDYLLKNKITSYAGMPSKSKLALVYPVNVLEDEYKKFTDKVRKNSGKKITWKESPKSEWKEDTKTESPVQNTIIKKDGLMILGITIFNKEIGLTIR